MLHVSRLSRWRRALTVALAVIVPATIAVAASPQASALSKIKCKQTVGVASVDPIMFHNQKTTMAHSHQFFGNNGWLARGNYANYADLMSKGTNCRIAGDTAGYWTPTLRYTATKKEIPVQAFTAYYRPFTGVGGPDFGPGMAFPQDTRLVASQHSWTCGQYMPVKPSQTVPDCRGADGSPGKTLTLHIDFPNCWNGVRPRHYTTSVGNTSDNANYRYSTKVKGVPTCPTGFPYKMISLRETLQFKYIGAGTDVELSSDPMMGKVDGASAHGDFWNTWQPTALASMVKNCISGTGRYTKAECDA